MTVIPLCSCPQHTQCSLSSQPRGQRKLWTKADQVALGEFFAVSSFPTLFSGTEAQWEEFSKGGAEVWLTWDSDQTG